uniref:Biotin carboxyl carrier protein of acetyl-CoA carboxylase n=1 Tax=Corallina officinalis TaxID=35170 RepID=A0A6M3WCU6_COROI|nr:acetyl-CoA carboxylase biotin carboxyl carrier protein [Corallina officinalis]QJF58537.1 acetyl-CoA carboxylase biotin carboxyl carrier protein [Corallina officinalis]QJF58736.1 acetyl-CoA carboxylase biotin carboxyl carrier protein [Corallina officinalis]QJF58935.1 acetyl-CoA carboxylase biotin carboxyl carrier protein [Corallina officinalis]
MDFKITDLRPFLLSVTKHKVNNIDIKSKNLKMTINTVKNRRKAINKTDIFKSDIKTTIRKNNTQKTNLKKDPVRLSSNNETDTYFTIISPMIGTFYRSPAPSEAAFIEINDKVSINQTVCIIEAMKLMNEIESEVNGHVVEILVQDGDIVDCGQALMRVKHI